MLQKENFTFPAQIRDVVIHDSFFSRLMETVSEKLLPYQWQALNDQVPGAVPSYCMRNFKAAAGKIKAEHGGYVFQDSDMAKWIEAASYSLMWKPDAELEQRLDDVIALIGQAQQPDGYLDTYYILTGLDKRWTNLMNNHELYCAGHMLEAAVAHYKATGKRSLLDIMLKFLDHIDSVIGPEEGKLHGYPGHEVLEMALVKLYEVEPREKYLRMAAYFINQRGTQPNFFREEAERSGNNCHWDNTHYGMDYYQAGRPVREQQTANGHAVRAGYLYSGMADVARETGDESLFEACRRLWDDIVHRQMYITGAVGQSDIAEAFSFDYDLPNDLIYGETCAQIALAFFAQRMLRLEPKAEYADVLEKILYNAAISGMSLDGTTYFYVNPMDSFPRRSKENEQFKHVKPVRQKWLGCACCPPNLGRLIASLPQYLQSTRNNTVFMHLYTTCESSFALQDGRAQLHTVSNYPWDGKVSITVAQAPAGFTLALRVPGWCKQYTLHKNGAQASARITDGYAYLSCSAGDEVTLQLAMPIMVMRANPLVRADAGKVAVQRGPLVYCAEQADNGDNLQMLRIDPKVAMTAAFQPETLGGVVVIQAAACRVTMANWKKTDLYSDAPEQYEPARLKLIPYYAWANRGEGEMLVWLTAL